MGIRSSIKARIKERLGNIRVLGKVIHEEAKHPGRPQPHMAARNPLWGGEDENPDSQEHLEKKQEEIDHPIPEERRSPDGEEFWFLKDNDGDDWSATNPGNDGTV
jgi:hypothetical protein